MELFNRKLKKLFLFQEGTEKSPKTNKKYVSFGVLSSVQQ